MKFTKKETKQRVIDVAFGDIFYDPNTDDYYMMIEQEETDLDHSECIRISNGERVLFKDEQEVGFVNYKLEIG